MEITDNKNIDFGLSYIHIYKILKLHPGVAQCVSTRYAYLIHDHRAVIYIPTLTTKSL